MLVERKADTNKLRSLLAISEEAILLQAKSIALVGEVTIGQIINEQNGTTRGELEPSITRIIGNRVQTGQIISNNYSTTEGSLIDLDNGEIILGGSANPAIHLTADGDAFFSGSVTASALLAKEVEIDGMPATTTLEDIAINAEQFIDADDIADALEESSMEIHAQSSTLFVMDNPSNSASVTLGAGGISATNTAGQTTFTVNASTGAAVFKGDITGASGTFSGTLATAGYISATGESGTGNGRASIRGEPNGIGTTGVYGKIRENGFGVHGYSSGSSTAGHGGFGSSEHGTGVIGQSKHGVGVRAAGTQTDAVALEISGRVTKTRVSGHLLKVYNATTGDFVGTFEYEFL